MSSSSAATANANARSLVLTEVIGTGRLASQFLRLVPSSVALPRGVCPGSVSTAVGTPIVVCTPASSWNEIVQMTIPSRRTDLVLVGNGLLFPPNNNSIHDGPTTLLWQHDVTVVVPHYAIVRVGHPPMVAPSTGSPPPPTYIAGKHAAFVEQVLHSDGIVHAEIVAPVNNPRRFNDNESEEISDLWFVAVKATQKLLWSSCLWLLCHASLDDSNHTITHDVPMSVSEVHAHRSNELTALVQELWPAFCRVALDQQCAAAVSTKHTSGGGGTFPTLTETLAYMQQYSFSIPNAIPDRNLALTEWRARNGVFADHCQPLHRRLMETVVATNSASSAAAAAAVSLALSMFDSPATSTITTTIASSLMLQKDNITHAAIQDGQKRIVDLRSTIGLSVYGNSEPKLEQNKTVQQQQHPGKKVVVVVGAGLLGSSVALNLARSNLSWNVTVIDSGENAHDMRPTTQASWGWLNANQKEPRHYRHLNCWGMHAWRCDPLLRQLPIWNGSLVRYNQPLLLRPSLDSNHSSATTTMGPLALNNFYDTAHGPLSRQEWLTLEPHARFSKDQTTREGNTTAAGFVYSFPNEGHVDPCFALRTIRQSAKDSGVAFVWKCTATSIAFNNDTIATGVHVLQEGGSIESDQSFSATIEADIVVVAAGIGSSSATLGGVPMLYRPGSISIYDAPTLATNNGTSLKLSRVLVDTVEKSHVLQRRDGALVVGGGELEVGGSSRASNGLAEKTETPDLRTKHESLLEAGGCKLASALFDNVITRPTLTSAVRPMPSDGLPSIGFIRPGLYSLVTHSGVTLAPLLGSLAAAEITENISLDLLAPYRPSRFTS